MIAIPAPIVSGWPARVTSFDIASLKSVASDCSGVDVFGRFFRGLEYHHNNLTLDRQPRSAVSFPLIFHQHNNVVGAEPQQRPEVRLRWSAGIVASAVSHALPTRPLIIQHKGSNP